MPSLKRYLLIVPTIVTLNWKDEFESWISKTENTYLKNKLYIAANAKDNIIFQKMLATWYKTGGAFIISYKKFQQVLKVSIELLFVL